MTQCSSGEDNLKNQNNYEEQNGWQKEKNGWAKTIRPSSTNSIPEKFEMQKLLNRKITKESLEEKMARVAQRKQEILEKKKATARKFSKLLMTPRVKKSTPLDHYVNQDDVPGLTQRVNRKSSEEENGWEKRPNGWAKTYKSISYKPALS